jgi:hypothetical protein
MTIPSSLDSEEFDVRFLYLPDWDIYFNLNCHDGELCRPNSASLLLNIINFGYNQYKFFYDISFPVMVILTEPEGLDMQNGYSFQFASEVNIRHNKPLRQTSNPLYSVDQRQSLFCNSLNSGNITIRLEDAFNNSVSGGVIAYTCGKDSCIIGKTNSSGYLVSRFPICFGGILSVVKEGYLGSSYYYDVSLNKSESLTLKLNPLIPVNFTIKKRSLIVDQDNVFRLRSDILPLTMTEYAYVELEYLGDVMQSFKKFLVFNSSILSEQTELAPGPYKITIDIYNNKTYHIPKSKKCTRGSWPFAGKKCFNIPEINMSLMPEGKVTFKWNFTYSQLNNSIVNLYAVAKNLYIIPESQRNLNTMDLISYELNSSFFSPAMLMSFQPKSQR